MGFKSPSAAAHYIEGLYSACQRLADFPRSGRRYNDTFRVLVFRNHLVFHYFDATSAVVSIAMVVDGRRDLKAFFAQRLD